MFTNHILKISLVASDTHNLHHSSKARSKPLELNIHITQTTRNSPASYLSTIHPHRNPIQESSITQESPFSFPEALENCVKMCFPHPKAIHVVLPAPWHFGPGSPVVVSPGAASPAALRALAAALHATRGPRHGRGLRGALGVLAQGAQRSTGG